MQAHVSWLHLFLGSMFWQTLTAFSALTSQCLSSVTKGLFINSAEWGWGWQNMGGGHRFLMNAYRGSFTFQTINGGGVMTFFGNMNPKISRFNTRRGYFFHYCCKLVHGTVQKTMLQRVQSDIIHIFVCLEKEGYAIFLTLMEGGGHAILSSRNGGGVNICFLTLRRCLPPPLHWNLWTVPKFDSSHCYYVILIHSQALGSLS